MTREAAAAGFLGYLGWVGVGREGADCIRLRLLGLDEWGDCDFGFAFAGLGDVEAGLHAH